MTNEEQLIGALMLDMNALDDISDLIEPQMFTQATCGLIYAELRQGADVYKILEKYKDKPEVGLTLNYCVENTITSVKLKQSAMLLRDNYRARSLNRIIDSMKIDGTDIEDTLGKLQIAIDNLSDNKQTKSLTLGELASKCEGNYFREHESITLGMKKLDDLIVKLDRGDVTVIGARPSVGKSALSAQLAYQLSEKYKVGFFNLEMAPEQIYERYASMQSGIEMRRIRKAKNFLGDEQEKFAKGNEILKQSNLRIVSDCYSVDDIRRESKAFGFDVIVVDYLQLVQAKTTYKGNRVAEVGEVSRDFKLMAKALNCHIILLSQLNRKTEDKQRPTMAELRESGAIEQDASNILLMWNLKTEGEKGLKVEKCRNGVLGGIVLGFDGSHMTFSELDKELEEEEKWETKKKTPFS